MEAGALGLWLAALLLPTLSLPTSHRGSLDEAFNHTQSWCHLEKRCIWPPIRNTGFSHGLTQESHAINMKFGTLSKLGLHCSIDDVAKTNTTC